MRPARAAKVHYLAENKGERTPHRFLVLDTEARWESAGRRELHQLRCWSGRLVRRHDTTPRKPRLEDFRGTDLDSLLETVETCSRGESTLWVFTHNLSYDLGLTRLPLRLLEQGWELGAHNLASDAPWGFLRRKGHGLRLADSFSWFPVSVETLGQALGYGKPALPAQEDPPEVWALRCAADAAIVAEALERAMDDWDRRRLGWWSLTGPASGWNSLRHLMGQRAGARRRTVTRTPAGESASAHRTDFVIDPDPEARAFERQALYSGRRDLWRVGPMPGGPWVELDLKTAHLAVMARCRLPYRRWVRFPSLELNDWRLANPGASLLARCLVQTETPRYPLRAGGAILHPVGTFETVLAGPELLDARDRGDLVRIGPGYGYHLGDQLQPWAQWALEQLDPATPDVSPLLRIMVKGWSRTVPGRWGMTVAREVAKGPSHIADWALEPAALGNPPRRGFILHLAGAWTSHARDQEADDAFPAVLAHIQSWTRLLLNRALEGLPEGCLASCNTEGFWVHQAALDGLARLAIIGNSHNDPIKDAQAGALVMLNRQTAPLELRVKRTAARLRVRTPQHLEVDGERQFAGVPRSAEELEAERYRFWTWPKLAGQIERGDPRGYVRELKTVDLSGLPVSRWAFLDGCCEPVRASWSRWAGTELLGPPADGCSLHGAALRPVQHPALRGLR